MQCVLPAGPGPVLDRLLPSPSRSRLPLLPQVSLYMCAAGSPDGLLYTSSLLDCYALCGAVRCRILAAKACTSAAAIAAAAAAAAATAAAATQPRPSHTCAAAPATRRAAHPPLWLRSPRSRW